MVLWRELHGNAVNEKSVAEGIGVGIGKICGRLKNQPYRFGGGDFEKPPELYCILKSGHRPKRRCRLKVFLFLALRANLLSRVEPF